MESIVGCVGSYDNKRWSPEKQHELFNLIRIKNKNVYRKMLLLAPSMNGHSCDIAKIAVTMSWQQIMDTNDNYLIWSIPTSIELAALFLNDEVFIEYLSKNYGYEYLNKIRTQFESTE